jgi:hypothetical protein
MSGQSVHQTQAEKHEDSEGNDAASDDNGDDDDEDDEDDGDGGFWAFSNKVRQFSYHTADNKPQTKSQSDRHQVWIIEEKRRMGYDFGRRQWF